MYKRVKTGILLHISTYMSAEMTLKIKIGTKFVLQIPGFERRISVKRSKNLSK